MTETESVDQAGRFTGRDLSRFASRRAVLLSALFIAGISGLASWIFAHNPDPTRPMRGSSPTVLAESIQWGFADAAGLLGAVFVALLPFLQLLRNLTARSVEGLSLWAWLLSAWAMIGSLAQGINESDSFLIWVSTPAALGSVLVLATFVKFGRWSWRAFGWAFLLSASSAVVLENAARVGSTFMWLACLLGVVPLTSVVAIKLVTAILRSPSRRSCSQAVHLIGAIGYVFWFVQAVQTSNVPMAAVAVIMAAAFIAGLAALLYLGVVSDDGVSAAEVVLYRQVKTVPRAIAMHEPVFDKAGRLIDLELVWANDTWQSFRNDPIATESLASEHRVRFDELLPYLRRAWDEGRSVQFFQLDRQQDERTDMYNYSDSIWNAEIEVETVFVRMESGAIMEWGDDLDSKIQLGSELELQRKQAEQRRSNLAARLAAQSEHARFTRELHDNILQELFVISLRLEAVEPTLGLPSETAKDIGSTVGRLSSDIRALIENSKQLGTQDSVEFQLQEIVDNWKSAGVDLPEISLSFDPRLDSTVLERMRPDVVDHLVSIVREALSNAVRHSGAEDIVVSLSADYSGDPPEQILRLEIDDNGKGLPLEPTRLSGLQNMMNRAEEFGATMNFDVSARATRSPGTLVRVLIPISNLMSI